MSGIRVVAGNELRRLFVQPLAWALLAVVLGLLAYFFLLALDAFLALMPKLAGMADAPGVTDLVALPVLRALANLLMLIVPLLTMRQIAGERQAATLPLLQASGLGDARVILGKYFGLLGYLAVVLGLALMVACSPAVAGTLDYGRLLSAAFGVLLFAAALTALGLLASSYSEQPAIAAAVALALNLLLWIVDAGARAQGVTSSAINYVALPTHLDPFFRGIVSTVDIVYFMLFIAVALGLATRRLDTLRTLA